MQDLSATLHSYFRGEKLESGIFLLVSVALLAGAVALVLVRQPFARSLGFTLIGVAAVGLVVGGTVYFRTDGQVAGLERLLAGGAQRLVDAEVPRMEAVVRSFAVYRVLYSLAALAAAGLAWATSRPALQGLAVGLLVFAAFGLVIDHYAEHRALRYLAGLRGEGDVASSAAAVDSTPARP